MNKWVVFTLFYLALAVSLSYESTPWVRIAWLVPVFAVWIASFVVVVWFGWKRRDLPSEERQLITALHQIFPKSWRDWIEGEGKHRSRD
jgi:hypothetical protein